PHRAREEDRPGAAPGERGAPSFGMTKTQYYTATSIDGFIADADNSLEWLFEAASNGIVDDRVGRFFADVGAMALVASAVAWDLVGQYADRGLLDEILLGVAPVMLGSGAPLFPRRLGADHLTLQGVEHDDRFVFLTYRVGHE